MQEFSGYRTLNIFRLIRQKMLDFEPDIFIINAMLYDSPAENGQLHNEIQIDDTKLWFREWLWDSRLNYVFQLSLRRTGMKQWEDLPWPIHLHQLLDDKDRRKTRALEITSKLQNGQNNEVFKQYLWNTTINNSNQSFGCQSPEQKLPKPVFPTCQILQKVPTINLKRCL